MTDAHPSWLIENFIKAGDIVLLSGRIDAAKTTVAVGWAMAVATGTPWRGRPVTRGSVLYLGRPTESGRKELESAAFIYSAVARSTSAASKSKKDDIPVTVVQSAQLDLMPRRGLAKHREDSFFDILEWHRRKYGTLSLVVIDTIANYFHDDIFQPEVADQVVAVADAVSTLYNCAVVLVLDAEPADPQTRETLVRLTKAANAHYVYRVDDAKYVASPGETINGTLVRVVFGSRANNSNTKIKPFKATFNSSEERKSAEALAKKLCGEFRTKSRAKPRAKAKV